MTEGGGERKRTLDVGPDAEPTRLDRMLAAHWPDLSRSRLKALILDGHLTVGGMVLRDPSHQVRPGATLVLEVPEASAPEPKPENIPLHIVYEDDDLIVIDKPAGLVVHPAAGHDSGTLVNALIAHCGDSLSGIGGVKRPGIVHRLDKDTTGLMVVAKNDAAHASLSAQFADHGRTGEMRRRYTAFVWGALALPSGTVDAPLDRHQHAREKMAVRTAGRFAVTHWQRIAAYPGRGGKIAVSRLACTLETGRTHQIRVHMAHINHPLLGDAVYGAHFRTKAASLSNAAQAALTALNRQALHADLLALQHPRTGEVMEWHAELPPDLAALADALAAA
jgi:23S rRNA pseudouridine1911/1915/1917 synthase